METPRPLVADVNRKENSSKVLLPVEDLLDALTDLCQNSRFGLALLKSTARTIKTNPVDYSHLFSLGELALQFGTITDFPPTGYSPQRWSFWVQRLTELTRCGIENIERRAKFCLSPMRWAGDDTKAPPGGN
ncbi:unnamed protein product [Clonostachys solani]|uniref:Uncharacterized protein n=1 Tax=Clonostachys solani TaxID=160281 RepID=A0A9N9Z652_9HYPO|nr:unnamed protein product [Clonostachys solani]